MLKGILDKFLNTNQKLPQPEVKSISHAEVEALVEARLKEHAATIEQSVAEKMNSAVQSTNHEENSLSPKQIEFALSLIAKTRDFELAINPATLKVRELEKLIAYNRYKNKGILVNLVKKGVLQKKG
ncbi:hypothetical protein BABA_10741 [Neobacillus bataviensis LMG 21833]|uniref:Uncharacterized protein n=1 Tax=Neobacillus bataviensis LMG 21833 TaxID=1117379 RepID=K6DLZ4_9BACI|nr:hypothetical protein BABA_10741 [Neobacillus bataviensis LMG 21833]